MEFLHTVGACFRRRKRFCPVAAYTEEKDMSVVLALICGVAAIILDQATKYLVVNGMVQGATGVITVIPGVLRFDRIAPNTGAAFGIFAGKTWFLVAVTGVIMIFCVYLLVRKAFDSKLLFWAICLVLSGGIGNMIDRIFRGGNVVDFIELPFLHIGRHYFPVFNVADCAVCIGAALIVIYFLADLIADTKKKNREKSLVSDSVITESDGLPENGDE